MYLMDAAINTQVLTELAKHGWSQAPADLALLILARREVETFRGIQFARIDPIKQFENGVYALSATFESRGENALGLCHVYFRNLDEIPGAVERFHSDVMAALAEAFSVRMAMPAPVSEGPGPA